MVFLKQDVSFCLLTASLNLGIKQVIEIPIGSYSAPFFWNLFFYYYESKWINRTKKADSRRDWCFENVFRFIDDLNELNDCVEKHFHEIYPPELELGTKTLVIYKDHF